MEVGLTKLTASQDRAADPEKDVIASAGAGTGKTRLLSERFLRTAISSGEKVSKIAALTFTEKAAAEMWDRICQTAFDLYWKDKDERWLEIYHSLDGANISTIHSFCHRLLSQMPFKAGLSPDFEVNPEDIVPEDCVIDFLSEQVKDDEMRREVLRLIKRYSRRRLKDILCQMFKKRQIIGAAVMENEKIDEEKLVEEWQRNFLELWSEFWNIVEKNADKILPKAVSKNKTADKWRWLLDNIPQKSKFPDEKFIEEMNNKITRLGLNEIDEKLDDFRKLLKEFAINLSEAYELAHDIVSISRLYTAFEDFIWLGTDRSSTVDYNGLLIRAKELIEKLSPEEQRKILPSYILLDEFQDTSPLQWEIFKLIEPNAKKILLVGDEKQSIYRFRGADVSIMRDGEDLISHRGGEKIVLDKNFRTGTKLLNLLNKIFENTFPEKTEVRYEARFQKLESTKDYESSLRLVLMENSEGQADAVVNVILAALEGQFFSIDGRNVSPGDFLVLAYQRNLVFEILKKLRERNVPAVPLVESGFYYAPEVATLFHLAAFLSSQQMNGSLYYLLRSPVFNIDDEEIFQIRTHCKRTPRNEKSSQENETLWECIEHWAHENRDENDRIVYAYTTLKNLLEFSHDNPLDVVPKKFLDTDGVFYSLCSYLPDVATANVKKFLAKVNSLVSEIGMNNEEIFKILKAEREQDATGYAPPLETKDVVRISTIHSAKGLEAEIVVVADPLKLRNSNSGDFYFEPTIAGKIIPIPYLDNYKTFVHHLAGAIGKDKRDAEYKRLFYVALTRAKRHLIVVGKIKANSFIQYILSGVGFDQKGKLPEDHPEGLFTIKSSEIKAPQKWKEHIPEEKPIKDLTSTAVKPKKFFKISVVRASHFVACPEFFFKKFLENGGIFGEENFAVNNTRNVEKSSKEFGNIVHKLLSYAPFKSEKHASAMAQKISDDEKIKILAEKFFKSKYNKILLESDILQEIPVYLNTGELVLTGFPDVLLKNPYEVWDYKTGRHSKLNEILYSAQINIYRLIYAASLGKNPAEIVGRIIWIEKDKIFDQIVEWDAEIEDKLKNLANSLYIGDESAFSRIYDGEICASCGLCD
ncbi:hypothetical protein DRQ26_02515 [bacterium]|nr:MAG: hypothetical protein DRQ26_02515 [bacterium]